MVVAGPPVRPQSTHALPVSTLSYLPAVAGLWAASAEDNTMRTVEADGDTRS